MATTLEKESLLRQRMEDAADRFDFILAGSLQKELMELLGLGRSLTRQEIADLEDEMMEAASQQDYIAAGKIQSDLQSFQERKQQVGPRKKDSSR